MAGRSANVARHFAVATLLATTALVAGSTGAVPVPVLAERTDGAAPGPSVSVIVRETASGTQRAELAVVALGGRVVRRLNVIGGFTAELPQSRLTALRARPSVHSVSRDGSVQLSGGFDGFSPKSDSASMYWIAQEVTGAGELWNAGARGRGVDVALIDSGVAPVDGLSAPGKVLHGPDLSFESQHHSFRHLDTYGHGTHLAGIIAGRDTATPVPVQKGEESHFVGMAPEARVISVKVADSHGNTDVSQVIAAIDWVVQHRREPGHEHQGPQSELRHRLGSGLPAGPAHLCRRGRLACGDRGGGRRRKRRRRQPGLLNNPAHDPFVIAVGGADGKDTYGEHDDVIGTFSSRGTTARRPDLVAPGKSVVSLLSSGSRADVENPTARVGTRQIRGSGTSQAAAVVSGAAALIVSQRPSITPNQVKKLLTSTARRLPAADPLAQGAGMIDLKVARSTATPSPGAAAQLFAPSTGAGSLEGARGTGHLSDAGTVLRGEVDVFGAPFVSGTWAAKSLSGTSWVGGGWNGNLWSGDAWSGNSWSSVLWSGNLGLVLDGRCVVGQPLVRQPLVGGWLAWEPLVGGWLAWEPLVLGKLGLR